MVIKLFIDFWNFDPTNFPRMFFVSGISMEPNAFPMTGFFAPLKTAKSSFGSLQGFHYRIRKRVLSDEDCAAF